MARRAEQPSSRSIAVGLDVEDTHARHTDHIDGPPAAGRLPTATLPGGKLMDGTVAIVIQTRLQSLRDQAAAADRQLGEFLQSSGCGR
jgi:hypothetical protein